MLITSLTTLTSSQDEETDVKLVLQMYQLRQTGMTILHWAQEFIAFYEQVVQVQLIESFTERNNKNFSTNKSINHSMKQLINHSIIYSFTWSFIDSLKVITFFTTFNKSINQAIKQKIRETSCSASLTWPQRIQSLRMKQGSEAHQQQQCACILPVFPCLLAL